MRVDVFFLVLFVLYCLEAGLFLVLAPWNAGWDRLAYRIPIELLRELLLWPVFRGAVTGFGLLHLLWGLHDLHGLLSRQRRRRRAVENPIAGGRISGGQISKKSAAEQPEPPEHSPSTQAAQQLRDAG